MSKEELFVFDRDHELPYSGSFSCWMDITDAHLELIEAYYLFIGVSEGLMRGLLLQQIGQLDQFRRIGILDTTVRNNTLVYETRKHYAGDSILAKADSEGENHDGDSTVPSQVLTESGSAEADAQIPEESESIGGASEDAELHQEPTRAGVPQNQGDMTQVLYDQTGKVPRHPFERLTPQVIELI